MLEVSVMLFFVLGVMVFSQQSIPS